ncbi:MAG: hypothetical protein ACTS42_00175 [Candidatus Hodgkinia cicadicola]
MERKVDWRLRQTYTKRGNCYDLTPKLSKQVEEINLKEYMIDSSAVN